MKPIRVCLGCGKTMNFYEAQIYLKKYQSPVCSENCAATLRAKLGASIDEMIIAISKAGK